MNDLTPLNSELGASLVRWRGLQVPSSFGGPRDEYRRIREGVGLWDRSWMGALRVSGVDRRRFLNGLMTCDVASLDVGRSVLGFFTDARGRILAEAVVLAREDDLVLEVPPGCTESVACHMLRFRVADRVEVEPMRAYLSLTLVGPKMPGDRVPALEKEWTFVQSEIDGLPVLVDRRPIWGLPAHSLWVRGADAESMARSLLANAEELGPVGFQALETARVEDAFPVFGQDYGEENLPQETGLDSLAVSYSKGCYLGQEVVSRVHFRGLAQRILVGIELEGEEIPGEGTRVFLDGKAVGRVTSAASSWSRGGVGLAMVHRKASKPGTRMELETGSGAVVAPLSQSE